MEARPTNHADRHLVANAAVGYEMATVTVSLRHIVLWKIGKVLVWPPVPLIGHMRKQAVAALRHVRKATNCKPEPLALHVSSSRDRVQSSR
jgi:hypothetical protein